MEKTRKYIHICEVCGRREILTPEEGYEDGWDYPPSTCSFGSIAPRKCGSTEVWFICQNNTSHKYKMTPADRLEFEERNMEPCQICRGYRRNKSRIYRKKR